MTKHTMLSRDEARSRDRRYSLHVLTSWALFIGLCFGVIYGLNHADDNAITVGLILFIGIGLYGLFHAISGFLKRRDPLTRILSVDELRTLKIYYDHTPEVRRWFQEGYERGCVPRLRDLREAEREQAWPTAAELYRDEVYAVFYSDDR